MAAIACVIRPGQAGDTTRILELCQELDDFHRTSHPESYRESPFVRDPASVANALQDPKIGLFVAEILMHGSPTVVGFVRAFDTQTPDGGVLAPRRFALLDELVVTAASRRNGLGEDLLAAAEAWAAKRGIRALEVTVWAFNSGAQSLYRDRGFQAMRHYLRKPLATHDDDDS